MIIDNWSIPSTYLSYDVIIDSVQSDSKLLILHIDSCKPS